MSDDLIRRSDAIKALDANFTIKGKENMQTVLNYLELVRTRIEDAPSVEPKRGEWIWHEDDDICNCSECEFEIDATRCIDTMEYVGVFHFCPNCGAKMKGADDE